MGVALEIFRKQKYEEGRGSLAKELLEKIEESGESVPDEITEILKRERNQSQHTRK